MKFLVFALLFTTVALAHIEDERSAMVSDNRVPKSPTFSSVCTECESLVNRIVEV